MTNEELRARLSLFRDFSKDKDKRLSLNATASIEAECVIHLDQIIAALESDRWIPVSEKLPEEGQRVIAFESGDTFAAVRGKSGNWVTLPGMYGSYPTHWRPLPKGPGK